MRRPWGYDELVRAAIQSAADMRINRTRLMGYRYDAAKRTHSHPPGDSESGFHTEPPILPLPPLPGSIVDGKHYVVVEALFSLALPGFGMLNWRAFIEPESGAVLYLRALTDAATGLVFDRDPMTKTANVANLPNAVGATLDLLRDYVTLVSLGPVSGGLQALSGSFVFLTDKSAPAPALPTLPTPFNFGYASRTDNFAAVNAYYHCDRFFRMVQDAGFNIASYFNGTAFPVPVDHRGLGNAINAQCPETPSATASAKCSSPSRCRRHRQSHRHLSGLAGRAARACRPRHPLGPRELAELRFRSQRRRWHSGHRERSGHPALGRTASLPSRGSTWPATRSAV